MLAPREWSSLPGHIDAVMEYAHGPTLAHLLGWGRNQHRPPSPPIAAGIMVGLLRGLHAEHQATTDAGKALGIVHCDVSPLNILVGSDGVARILDVGVAPSTSPDWATPDAADATDAPTLVTSPLGRRSYMSPEQLRGAPRDRRTDIYAAAIVLWELLAGRRLFREDDRGAGWNVIPRPPVVPPSAYNQGISRNLDAVVLRALEPQPEHRFATAEELAEQLLQVVEVATPMEIAAWVRQAAGAAVSRHGDGAAQVGGRPGASIRPRWRWPVLRRPSGVSALRLGTALVVLGLGLLLRWSGNGERNAVANSVVDPMPSHSPPHGSVAVPRLTSIPAQTDRGPAAEAPATVSAPSMVVRAPLRTVSPVTAAVRTIEELNRKAARAYRQRDFAAARKLLYTALGMCSARRLDVHRQAALAHAQLAAVLVRGFRQRELAIERFRTALRIDNDVPVQGLLNDPAVSAAFRSATDSP